jgi:hypothetical protein
MSGPANESGSDESGFTWRLKQSGDKGSVGLDSPIVFELADALGSTLASVSMSSKTIEALLRPHLSIFAELQLDGSVSLDSELFALLSTPKKTDILELVKQGLAPEMLRDEPSLKERLNELRRKLTLAISVVDQTLANLHKPSA